MKKALSILTSIILCLLLCSPLTAYAETYSPSDTDISIELDNSLWYVFTRDNIKDNPELEELGIAYEYLQNALQSNNAYMDALLFYEDGTCIELFIRKKYTDSGIANFSNHDDEKIMEFSKDVAKRVGAETYSTYETQYKYAYTEYKDTNLNVNLLQYTTVVNKDIYSITLQSETAFDDSHKELFKNIIDTVTFDVDSSIKEESSDKDYSFIWKGALKGAVAGGVGGLIVSLITKASKKKKAQKNNDIE
ncbi:MAG: hypothetical protein IKJ83_01750 [Ruminococcus sp.]|nr:hypothetical protein [Ruminococcus sp.]